MELNSITPKQGTTRARKRVGRGNGSGLGTYAGRGRGGQGQRKSRYKSGGFEGGQTSILSRLPKLKGFKNPNKVVYQVVNVSDLDVFKDGEEVNAETLAAKKLVRKASAPIKILGNGKITKKVKLKVQKVSASAKDKVIAAGGSVL